MTATSTLVPDSDAALWYFQDDGDLVVDAAVASLGQPAPPVMALLAEPDSIHVLPALDADFPPPPPPWDHVPALDAWTRSTAGLTGAGPLTAHCPYSPVLVPLGSARGGILLVNLDALDPLVLNGSDKQLAAVVRAWVMNLLLVPGRIVASTSPAVAELDTVGSERFITAPGTAALRHRLEALGVSPDVVIVDDVDAAEHYAGVACIISTVPLPREGWSYVIDGSVATLKHAKRNLALELDAITAIAEDDWHELMSQLATTATGDAQASPRPAAPASSDQTSAPQPSAEAAEAAVAPEDAPRSDRPPHIWVRILGEPTIIPLSGEPISSPGRERVWTAVVAYLTTVGRNGASREELRACWGQSSVSAETIRQTISRVRRELGQTEDGSDAWPELSRGGRRSHSEPPQQDRLHPSVLSDWDVWQQLVGDSPANATDQAIADALDLVHGPAFDYPPGAADRYEWAKYLVDEITDAVPDAAYELATRRLGRGDAAGAVQAALSGLAANPQRQDLWRIAIGSTPADTRSELITKLQAAIPAGELETQTRSLLP